MTGTQFAKSTFATGALSTSQVVTASGAINQEAGGQLLLLTKNVEFDGTIKFMVQSDKSFGTK